MNLLHLLYHTVPGRVLLKPLSSRIISRASGAFLDSRASKFLIRPFIKKNGIPMEEYETEDYRCFNDCFSRHIREGQRPYDQEPGDFAAPCDGLLSVWPVTKDTVLPVKQSLFSVPRLLQDPELAERYQGGICLVFRLCVNHYHRYAYAESGEKSVDRLIPGAFHTVRPVALESMPVFTENTRVYTQIRTERFGTIVQMEVGAMLVGKIANHEPGEAHVERGQEKGTFLYGGSTIIVLVEKDRLRIDPALLRASAAGEESPVRMGQKIGEAIEFQ